MDWPYPDDDTVTDAAPPTWECPDDTCQCNPTTGKGEPVAFSIMLLTPTGERMGGALCRIRHQGHVLNDPQPTADGSGWVNAKVPHAPTTVLVEWAPADAPQTPGYPYRTLYYVAPANADRDDEAGRRRLCNLGYNKQLTLTENIKAFQREYGYQKVSGKLEDIEQDLDKYHDDACPPVTKPEAGSAEGQAPEQGTVAGTQPTDQAQADKAFFRQQDAGGGGNPEPQELPTAAPPQEGQDNHDQTPQKLQPQSPSAGLHKPQGVARKAPVLKSINEAIADGTALYEWAILSTMWTDPTDSSKWMSGMFWTFSDALMVELPDDAIWGFWKGTKVDQPLPKSPEGNVAIGNRKRLVRLPCKGIEAQAAADALSFSQADLMATAGTSALSLPAASGDKKVPCLLPTAELYNQVYLQADVRIERQQVAMTGLPANALTYAENVALAIQTAQSKAGTTSMRMLGTPGKIWAIADRMDTWVFCKDPRFQHWSFACINHGFHRGFKGKTAKGVPILDIEQNQGGCHNWEHTDYSQIFTAVAGWCLVKKLDDPASARAQWMRTEAVYADSTKTQLWRLVRDNSAVPATRYVGNVKHLPQPANPP